MTCPLTTISLLPQKLHSYLTEHPSRQSLHVIHCMFREHNLSHLIPILLQCRSDENAINILTLIIQEPDTFTFIHAHHCEEYLNLIHFCVASVDRLLQRFLTDEMHVSELDDDENVLQSLCPLICLNHIAFHNNCIISENHVDQCVATANMVEQLILLFTLDEKNVPHDLRQHAIALLSHLMHNRYNRLLCTHVLLNRFSDRQRNSFFKSLMHSLSDRNVQLR